MESKEVVLRAAESAVARALAATQSGSAQKGPGQVAFPPEAPVVTASAQEVIVDLCAKLQVGILGFCADPDGEYAKYAAAWKFEGAQSAGPMETPVAWGLKKVAESLMEIVDTERPAKRAKSDAQGAEEQGVGGARGTSA